MRMARQWWYAEPMKREATTSELGKRGYGCIPLSMCNNEEHVVQL